MTRYLYPINFINGITGKQSDMASIARDRSLTISTHERIGEYALAIDRQKNILLHLSAVWKKSKLLVVDLKQVVSCSVIKQYSNIEAGGLEKNGLSHYITKIFLFLRFKQSGSLVLPMYNYSGRNKNRRELTKLEEKIGKWKMIVSDQLVVKLS